MFEKELALIVDADIRDIATQGVALIPDFFFSLPASSSGKYHPNYALGDGGLYRHVQAAIMICEELLRLEMFSSFSDNEKDLIRASIILHDGWKQGLVRDGHTIFEHPLVAAKALQDGVKIKDGLCKAHLDLICNNIETHMGQWNTGYKGETPLPKPQSKMQKFVHLCDYIASRKFLEVKFT
jgi:hypothetical protein